MGTVGRLLRDVFADGYKFVSVVAPCLSIFVALAKWQGWAIMNFRFADISYAWAFAPITVWFFIAYLRRWSKDQKLESEPLSNTLMADGLSYIMNESFWGLTQQFAKSLVGGSAGLRDMAIKGKIVIWGLPENGGTKDHPKFSTQELPIEADYWKQMVIDLENILAGPNKRLAETMPENSNNLATKNKIRYSRLCVDKTQIETYWPRPNLAIQWWAKHVRRPKSWRAGNI